MVLPKLTEHADGEHPGNVDEYALVGGVCGDDYGCRGGCRPWSKVAGAPCMHQSASQWLHA